MRTRGPAIHCRFKCEIFSLTTFFLLSFSPGKIDGFRVLVASVKLQKCEIIEMQKHKNIRRNRSVLEAITEKSNLSHKIIHVSLQLPRNKTD